RRSPLPRPVAVSKPIHAVVIPSAVSGGSVACHPLGCVLSSVKSSIRLISSGPSNVLMFQVNATRSRQKLSSWNRAAAASLSPALIAWSKSASHWSTSLTDLSSCRYEPPVNLQSRGARQQQLALAGVLGQVRGARELHARLVDAADLGQQV